MSLTPGHDWIVRLESLYLIDFSSESRRERIKRRIWWLLLTLNHVQMIIRFMLSAFIQHDDWSLYFGNVCFGYHVYPWVLALRMACFGAVFFNVNGLYLRWFTKRDLEPGLTFVTDIQSYDAMTRREPILKGHRKELFLQDLRVLKLVDKFLVPNGIISMTITVVSIMGFGALNMVQTPLETILAIFWIVVHQFGTYSMIFDMMYPLVFWYVCKRHLDLQVDGIIELLESKDMPLPVKISKLSKDYEIVIRWVKEFNEFSKKIISPYRFLMTISCAICYSGVAMVDIKILRYAASTTVALFYAASLTFLNTTSSLSIKRIKMYKLASSLFLELVQQDISIRERFVLRKIIKTLGDLNRPMISLTDATEGELKPFEMIGYIASCVSLYCLGSELFS